MSNQIPNKLHAVATVIAANPPSMIRSDGFESIARTGVGAYTLRLAAEPGGLQTVGAGPITRVNWAASGNIVFIAGQTGALAAMVRVDPADSRNVFLTCFDAAGAVVDGQTVQVLLWRLPTVD